MTSNSKLLVAAFVAACLSSGAWAADNSAKSTTSKSGAATQGTMVAQGGTRDWSKIDENNDNLIEPQEMQNYLDKAHAQESSSNAKSSSSSGADSNASSGAKK